MKSITKTISILALCLFVSAGRAVAEKRYGGYPELPFDPNPQAFTNYLNRWEWPDGKKRVFSGLKRCYEWNLDSGGLNALSQTNYYRCDYGYMTITDIMHGTRFCELSDSSSIVDGHFDDEVSAVYFRISAGGYTKVKHAHASYCRRP